MADDPQPSGLRVAAELLLVSRVPAAARVVLLVAMVIACGAVAQYSLVAQHHFASMPGNDRISKTLAAGSSAATAWPGWVAAACFGIALVRLRRGPPEPPAGRKPVESLTLAEMRGGLVREYTAARVALLCVALAAVLDVGRAARYAVASVTGDALAQASLVATAVEAAGLAVAAVVLARWALRFRDQLRRLGAVS